MNKMVWYPRMLGYQTPTGDVVANDGQLSRAFHTFLETDSLKQRLTVSFSVLVITYGKQNYIPSLNLAKTTIDICCILHLSILLIIDI